MAFAMRDGVRLYYLQEGSGDPPFVFVHGWCCDHTFFQPQFDHFKDSHAVTNLDLRGCGLSDRPENDYDIPTLTDDVAWLCGELRISKPVVVGHSLGGIIGIDLAARYPDLPAAIVAVDPGPIDPLPETVKLFEEFHAQLEGPNGEADRRAYTENLFLPTDDPVRKRSILDAMCSVPLTIASQVIRGVIAWNGVDAIKNCSVPLLILRAHPRGSNAPDRLLALKPDTQIGITVGAGHFHQLEVPDQVTPMIARFLQIAI